MEWQPCCSANGFSPGTAEQRKSDTVIDGRWSSVVELMPLI